MEKPQDLRNISQDELEARVIAHLRGFVVPSGVEIPPTNVVQFKPRQEPEDLVA